MKPVFSPSSSPPKYIVHKLLHSRSDRSTCVSIHHPNPKMEIFSNDSLSIEYIDVYKRFKITDIASGSWISLSKLNLKIMFDMVKFGAICDHITSVQKHSQIEYTKMKGCLRIEYTNGKIKNNMVLCGATLLQIMEDYTEMSTKIASIGVDKNLAVKRKLDDEGDDECDTLKQLKLGLHSDLHPDCLLPKYSGTQYYYTSSGIKKTPDIE